MKLIKKEVYEELKHIITQLNRLAVTQYDEKTFPNIAFREISDAANNLRNFLNLIETINGIEVEL